METLATVIAVLTIVTVIAVMTWMTWRTKKKVEEVHVLVNSRMTKMEERVAQLTATLEQAKVAVPPAPRRAEKKKALPES